MRLSCILALLVVGPVPSSRPLHAQRAPADSAWFLQATRQLLDANLTGDTTAVARLLAPDWIGTDANGRVLTRNELLAELRPLPAGQAATLTLVRWRFVAGTGIVVLAYDTDQHLNFHGQELLTTVRSTETWVRRRGRWVQVASQEVAVPFEVAGVPIDRAQAADWAGRYGVGGVNHVVVAVDDSGLKTIRDGGAPRRLYALADGIFVRRGARGFYTFERDAGGKVARLVYWLDNHRVVWQREP